MSLGSGVPAKFAILGSVGGFARPVLSPVSRVAFTKFANCLRKDLALVSHCVLGLGTERLLVVLWGLLGLYVWCFVVTAHFMCTVLYLKECAGKNRPYLNRVSGRFHGVCKLLTQSPRARVTLRPWVGNGEAFSSALGIIGSACLVLWGDGTFHVHRL